MAGSHTTIKTGLCAGVAAVALCATGVFAQQPPPAQPPQTRGATGVTAPRANNADESFVVKTAQANMAEVELGKMATEKASSSNVKSFGQRMVDDHTKAGDELKSIAKTKNVMLPSTLDPKHQALHDRLMNLSGDAFDRAYMQAMVSGHKEVASALQKESKSGKDPEVKAWAAKTLPTVEEHLKEAESANKVVGTSGKKP